MAEKGVESKGVIGSEELFKNRQKSPPRREAFSCRDLRARTKGNWRAIRQNCSVMGLLQAGLLEPERLAPFPWPEALPHPGQGLRERVPALQEQA